MADGPAHFSASSDDGTRLAAWRWDGDAKRTPFVLVHGLASNARTWDAVARRLQADGHPVASYDQRGHGVSDRPESGYDMDTAVADLAAVVEAAGLAEPPVVAGQSWGGNLVVAYGGRATNPPAAVAAVDGGTIDLPLQFSSWEACAAALAPPRLTVDLATIGDTMRAARPTWPEEGVRATLANLEEGPDGRARNRLPRAAHLSLVRAMWDHPPGDDYPRLAVPVLLLLADTGDAAWARAKRQAAEGALAAISRATLLWVKGDHDLHVEQPGLVADNLADASWRS